jgi:hypothetical protein
VSAQKWNWPARKMIASTNTRINRVRLPLICLIRRSLGNKGCQVKQFGRQSAQTAVNQRLPSRFAHSPDSIKLAQ